MSRKSRVRGTTLFETMIAAALVGLMMTYGFDILVAGSRYQKRVEVNAELDQAALAGMSLLVRELKESTSSAIVFGSNAVVFASPRDPQGGFQYDAAGRILWWKIVCYSVEEVNGVSCLVRREESLGSIPSSTIPRVVQTPIYFQQSNLPSRVVASDVTAVDGLALTPVEVHLTASRPALGARFSVTSHTRLVCQN